MLETDRRPPCLAALIVPILLAGCANLPSSGPTPTELVDSASAQVGMPFQIVDLTPPVLDALDQAAPGPSAGWSADAVPVDRIGAGDALSVVIFETSNELFSPSTTNADSADSASGGASSGQISLPRLVVDRNGSITVPFAGSIKVIGHTPREVEAVIEDRLKGKTANPQAIVTVLDNRANTVTLLGDVKTPGRQPLSLARERLLDAVAVAGGVGHPSDDILVDVTRGDRHAVERMSRITPDNAANLTLEPGDFVTVNYQPRSFTVFGASGHVSEIPFDTPAVTLAEALARTAGPLDAASDPRGIYLFRFETPAVLAKIEANAASTPGPVIYHLDLMNTADFFAMKRFQMRDKDLIYIANARTNRVQKFLGLLSGLFAPAASSRNLAQ